MKLKTEVLIQAGERDVTPDVDGKPTTLPNRMLLNISPTVTDMFVRQGTLEVPDSGDLEEAYRKAAETVLSEDMKERGFQLLPEAYHHRQTLEGYVHSATARTFIIGKAEKGTLVPWTTQRVNKFADGEIPFEFRYHVVVEKV